MFGMRISVYQFVHVIIVGFILDDAGVTYKEHYDSDRDDRHAQWTESISEADDKDADQGNEYRGDSQKTCNSSVGEIPDCVFFINYFPVVLKNFERNCYAEYVSLLILYYTGAVL